MDSPLSTLYRFHLRELSLLRWWTLDPTGMGSVVETIDMTGLICYHHVTHGLLGVSKISIDGDEFGATEEVLRDMVQSL